MARGWIPCFLVYLGFAGAIALAQPATPDSDRDGISDSQEQVLLEKFRPTFLISATDCAVRPARFAAGLQQPKSLARDGAVYGQVFRAASGSIEIHYYLLWDSDCGVTGHALDAEHVSVLLLPQAGGCEPDQAKAAYWYAAAHEDTVCEVSNAGRAEAVLAVDRGPQVWISSGKHASFLKREFCQGGCGPDRCVNNVPLPAAEPVINIGERNAPMNGALWIASRRWPLSMKMGSDFPPATLALLNAMPGDSAISLAPGRNRTARAVILGGDSTLDGAAAGALHTANALETADAKTSKSMDKAATATGNSLKRALKATFGWMAKKKSAKTVK